MYNLADHERGIDSPWEDAQDARNEADIQRECQGWPSQQPEYEEIVLISVRFVHFVMPRK